MSNKSKRQPRKWSRVRQINAVFQSPDFSRAPVFTDWSTAARFADDLLKDIPALLSGGMENPEQISNWLDQEGRKCWNSPVGLLHGDLKAENLLVTGDGTVLLDWQRPLRAPLPLEESLSILLERGIPEASGSSETAVFDSLACFYLAHWYAWAWRTCLPYPFVLKQAVIYASAGLSCAE